jgi:hypothetical protein
VGRGLARARLAVLRVHLGELELVGTTRRHYVVARGAEVAFYPIDPPQWVPHVLATCRELELGELAAVDVSLTVLHRFRPLRSTRRWDRGPVGRVVPLVERWAFPARPGAEDERRPGVPLLENRLHGKRARRCNECN